MPMGSSQAKEVGGSQAGEEAAAEGGTPAEGGAAQGGGQAPAEEGGADGPSPEEEAELDAESRQLEIAMKDKDRGAELYKEQKLTEAREAWAKALSEMPQGKKSNLNRLTVSLHMNLAQVCLTLKDYDEVVKQASSALALDEDNAKALFRRGIARDSLGQAHAAALDLKKAARIEPRHAEIRKKYEEFKKKALELDEKEDEDNPPNHDLDALPRAFIDVAVGSTPPRRMVFVLYTDTVPKTAENFRQLCTGEHSGTTARGKPFHYKGSLLHRIIPGLMVQGGDFDNVNGTGGESVYGRRFADERFADKHTRRGLLAMANDGPNTNGSNFFVSFAAAEHLDRHHVIFGELAEGCELLDELEKLPTSAECRPLTDCVITDCGELKTAS